MELNLANPLVFFDLETTGINIAKDRIVEISVLKVYPKGKEGQKALGGGPGVRLRAGAAGGGGVGGGWQRNFCVWDWILICGNGNL